VRALLLSDAGGASLVSAAVAALVVIFLTLPMVFLLAEHAQRRRQRSPSAEAILVAKPKPARGPKGIEIVSSATLPHDFEDEPLPRTLGHVPPDAVVQGPLEFGGHLQVGERAVVRGGIVARGSVALAPDAVVEGPVETGGHLHVGRSARIVGAARAAGDVRCRAFARVGGVAAGGRLVLMEGAAVEGGLEASEVERPLQPDRDLAGLPLA